MFDCPKCGSPLADTAIVCNDCKWEPEKRFEQKGGEQHWWRCADVDVHGNRCGNPGTMTESTHGAESWYCANHFRAFGSATTTRVMASPPAADPTSFDLTEQQWVNVCKFFPEAAKRCKRPFADLSDANPYVATASMGPMLGRMTGFHRTRPGVDNAVPFPTREPGSDDA